MPFRIRSRLTFANVISVLALFVALGGGAYAVTIPRNSVGAAQLRKNSVGRSELARKAVTSPKVKNHSLRKKDFKAGQLPAGPRGPQGPKGDTGTVDTSNFFTKEQSNGRFVAKADAQPYAWGQVRADASLRPVSSRVKTVTHPATGLYCVLLSGSPAQSELEGSAVTLAGTSPQAVFPHVTNGQGADCATEPGSHLNIRFFTAAGAAADARFSFVVP
jgi:hypothetical protein